ncbi:MAG: UDP-N-acetylglucosamine 2-epimerase (non-hydrolyzing) [Defluviitaleaceae bacterium]|nr:UDP-N-acetylglucosamine 2-epimerase (non-hydrolyzing) [Defluviitaleaceae bacterium]
MKRIKVLSVFGTRPEATKMVPLILEMRENPSIESVLCVTAQHRELLDGVLEPFGITPDYDLDLMTAGQTLTDITVRVLKDFAPVLEEVKPDILLVHGDTATTFAASLAAFYQRISVGHVEAGLRSYDKYRPYPEEVNRKITTAIADMYFAPTDISRENLLKENVSDEAIYVTGNTAIDFIKYAASEKRVFSNSALEGVDFTKRVILMTAHRRENRGQPMENICNAVKRIVADFPDTFLVWPVHPGKASKEPAHAILGGMERVLLTEPVDIYDMCNLMSRAELLLTDSGGLQEEAPVFDLPTIVLREVTERPEGLTAGTLTLAGVEENSIYNEAVRLLTDREAYEKMAKAKNPFGDGNASKRIVEAIIKATSKNKGDNKC